MKKKTKKQRSLKNGTEMASNEITTRIVTNSLQDYTIDRCQKNNSPKVNEVLGNKISNRIAEEIIIESIYRKTYYGNNYYPIPSWFDSIIKTLAADLKI